MPLNEQQLDAFVFLKFFAFLIDFYFRYHHTIITAIDQK